MFIFRLHPEKARMDEPPSRAFQLLWNQEPLEVIIRHRTSDVVLIRWPLGKSGGGPRSVFRKRYWYPGLSGKLRGFFRNTFFRRSRAKAEFENLNRLYGWGLSRVGALAYGEERRCRLLFRAFIVTADVEKTSNLESFLEGKPYESMALPDRRLFLSSLGRWVARLHTRSYRDHDLFARNVLVHGDGHPFQFSKIDSAKGSGGKVLLAGGLPYLKDLRDLEGDLRRSLSRTEQLRCLLAYLGAGKVDGEVKSLVGRLAVRVRAR